MKAAVIRIWDAESGRLLHTINGPPNDNLDFAYFLSDSKKIVTVIYAPISYRIGRDPTASMQAIAYVWDADSGRRLRTINGHFHDVTISEDGSKMAAFGNGAQNSDAVRIYDLESGRQLRGTYRFPERGYYPERHVSPDGRKRLTIHGNTVRIWTQ